jgi:MFS family permease
MEETAAYAIIADVEPEKVSLYLGICEISTGLGYMVGPPLGGWLFSVGGFSMPFVVLGVGLIPAAFLIYHNLPPDASRYSKDEVKADIPLLTLLRNPHILVLAVTSVVANSDYAFLEPTLGDHARDQGLASSPDSIGMLFSIASITYTVSCPIIGILANRDRFGPRPVIVTGLLLQILGFLLIGPSPLLRLRSLHTGQMVVSLILFGVGESMSMTPVMDDMMHACGDMADAAVNSLSSIMAASFSLGQMVGPLIGSGLASRWGFPWACTVMSVLILLHTSTVMVTDMWTPRGHWPKGSASYTELTALSVPSADSAED